MEAVLICTTQSPKCLQTRSPSTEYSGKNPLRASQSVGFRNALRFPKSNSTQSPWTRSTYRRLSIKNQERNEETSFQKDADSANITTPGATFRRLFTENTFLTSPKELDQSVDINNLRPRGSEIKDIGLKLIEAGKLKEAESLLRAWSNVYKEQDRLEALLAESLLYQGKYQEVVDLPVVEAIGPADTRFLLKAIACALLSDRYNERMAKWWADFKNTAKDANRLTDDLKKLQDLKSPEDSSELHERTKKLNKLIEELKGKGGQERQKPKEQERKEEQQPKEQERKEEQQKPKEQERKEEQQMPKEQERKEEQQKPNEQEKPTN